MRPSVLLLFLVLLFGGAFGMPAWFDKLLPQAPKNSAPRQQRDYYKSACRIINPDPYAFPGRAPYPAQPFCPY